jgi:putative PIN family toxin of toxin-antitoxin system
VRAVFDTNVLLAAFLAEGLCAKLLLRARRVDFDLYTCQFVLDELREVLTRKFKIGPKEIKETLALITEASTSLTPAAEDRPDQQTCRDPDDDHILPCARAASADYIVSGDRDLLDVEKWQGIAIVTPRDLEQMFV